MDLTSATRLARMHVLKSAATCMSNISPNYVKDRTDVLSMMVEDKINHVYHSAWRENTNFMEVLQISALLATQATSHYTMGQPIFSLRCWNELSNGGLTDVATSVWLYWAYLRDVKNWAALHLGWESHSLRHISFLSYMQQTHLGV